MAGSVWTLDTCKPKMSEKLYSDMTMKRSLIENSNPSKMV